MKLHKGDLFWDETRSDAPYERLNSDLTTDVLIIGGGMSGAMIANALTEDGREVVVIDKGIPGYGSTDGNTGIIQYNSDKSLDLMIRDFGEKRAVDFYRISLEAMKELGRIAKEFPDVGYKETHSLFLASRRHDINAMKKNFDALAAHGFPADWIDRQQLQDDFGIEAHAAIRTASDAELNPFKMVQALHTQTMKNGNQVYCETEGMEILENKDHFVITTSRGHKIRANYLILATGYAKGVVPEVEPYTQRNTTFSLVTHKIDSIWNHGDMIWDSADPYVYFRQTEDGRLIAGGLDETGTRFSSERRIAKQAKKILKKMKEYYPPLEVSVDKCWQSVFAVSNDGIPFIDRDASHPNRYFALGYGGNGTCYSVIASMFIREYLKGKVHPQAYTTAMRNRKK